MYCYVTFGENKEKHAKNYLYECTKELEPGDSVIVLTENGLKEALVLYMFSMIPENLNIEFNSIKKVVSKNEKMLDAEIAKSYLLAVIDEYKDGNCIREELYGIIKHFVNSLDVIANDDKLVKSIKMQLLNTGKYCMNELMDAEEKELYFWKELKDIEYKLRYGHSFWDKTEKEMNKIYTDPIEYTDEYLKIELELERIIRRKIGEGGYMGYCHKYWYTKKNILKNIYGINWKSPKDLNPMIIFD